MSRNSILLAGMVLVLSTVSGCGNLKPGVEEGAGTQIFAACEGELKTYAVSIDEANKRSKAYFNSGNRKDGCAFKRRAVETMNSAMQSFQIGQCKKFHEVASDYISWKMKNLQQRLVTDHAAAQADLKKDCGQA